MLSSAENLAVTESLVAFGGLGEEEWVPTGGLEKAHEYMDAALAAYVTAYLEENA